MTRIEVIVAIIDRLIRKNVVSVPELLSEFRKTGLVSDSSLRRWLTTIRDGLHGAYVKDGRPRRWGFAWPSDKLSHKDTVWALGIARSLLHPLSDTLIHAKLTDVYIEHMERLPADESTPHDYTRMVVARSQLVDPAGSDPETVDKLAEAIFRQRRIAARYHHTSGTEADVTLEPYALMPSDEGLFCLAHCVNSSRGAEHMDVLRIYNVVRFLKIHVLQERFAYPTVGEYNPESTFKHCFGIYLPDPRYMMDPMRVQLRFAPSWETFFKYHKVHPTQSAPKRQDDGSVEVSLDVYLSYDLVRWLRSHGNQVEILDPMSLRSWVKSGDPADAVGKYLTNTE